MKMRSTLRQGTGDQFKPRGVSMLYVDTPDPYSNKSTSKLCAVLTCSCSCRFRESASSTTTWSLPVRRKGIRSRALPDRHICVTVGLVDGFHTSTARILWTLATRFLRCSLTHMQGVHGAIFCDIIDKIELVRVRAFCRNVHTCHFPPLHQHSGYTHTPSLLLPR